MVRDLSEEGFKKHVDGSRDRAEFPAATISISKITLNKFCFDKFHRQPFCELWFKPAENIIAVKPTQTKTEGAKKLGITKYQLNISCKLFLAREKILQTIKFSKEQKSKRFEAEWSDRFHAFYINLNKER